MIISNGLRKTGQKNAEVKDESLLPTNCSFFLLLHVGDKIDGCRSKNCCPSNHGAVTLSTNNLKNVPF